MKKLILVLNLLAVCSCASAQSRGEAEILAATMKAANAQHEAAAEQAQVQAARSVSHSPLASSTCAFTFTSGAGDSFLKYCVTANGNITQLETPSGKEHIAIGAAGEGYGFCDLSSPVVRYFDYADFGDSGNWGTATLTSQTAKSLKIVRTTADGIWTLTQTISQVAGMSPSVKIVMTIKNNSNTTRSLFFMRYADVDAAGAVQNSLDGTVKSAFGWNSDAGNNPFGLVLQNAGPVPPDSSPSGFTQNVPNGPDPCNFAAHFASGTQIATDGSLAYLYALNLSKGMSKTVTLSYRGL